MAVVLIPGFMLTRDLWTDILPALEPFGPVIHADMSGESIADIARTTLERAPARFDLIGFSMGGYIAREIARLAPGRVSHLVLIATSSRGDGPLQAKRKSMEAAVAPEAFGGISRKAIRQSLAPDRENNDALIERVHAMSVQAGGETYRRQSSFRRDGDTDRLGDVRCPTLIVAGSDDRLRTLEESVKLQEGIQGASLAVIASGHMVPLEAPVELSERLGAFLTTP